jgi:dimethylaniline monooxygenase (N-oxide forming)
MAIETSEVAKRVTVSHHRERLLLPQSKILQKPDVKEITKDGVWFTDGTHECYSTIIHCTGYLYSYPYLSADCGIHVEENYVQPLWKHCINIRHPTMAIIGIPFNICPSHLSDIQVRKLPFKLIYFNKLLFLVSDSIFPQISYKTKTTSF